MPRQPRIEEQGIYNHVTARGSGRRQLFEDEGDKAHFLTLLKKMPAEEGCAVFAWCLMDNHVHLLLQGSVECITKMMQRMLTAYAHWFNGRHGHIGHVFQGRYASTPIASESHFLAAVKYIHLNPHDMGIGDPAGYPWSSYQEYVHPSERRLCGDDMAVDLLGGLDGFKAFHESDEEFGYISLSRRRLSDAEADQIARSICGQSYRDAIPSLRAAEKKAQLARLRTAGLSIRQIERLTGIGRGIIARSSL